jgi:hypothetical protein
MGTQLRLPRSEPPDGRPGAGPTPCPRRCGVMGSKRPCRLGSLSSVLFCARLLRYCEKTGFDTGTCTVCLLDRYSSSPSRGTRMPLIPVNLGSSPFLTNLYIDWRLNFKRAAISATVRTSVSPLTSIFPSWSGATRGYPAAPALWVITW